MKKWTIGNRQYFAAPVDTPEVRKWLEKLPGLPTFDLINALYFDALRLGYEQAQDPVADHHPKEILLDWKRSRVVEEIERRIDKP